MAQGRKRLGCIKGDAPGGGGEESSVPNSDSQVGFQWVGAEQLPRRSREEDLGLLAFLGHHVEQAVGLGGLLWQGCLSAVPRGLWVEHTAPAKPLRGSITVQRAACCPYPTTADQCSVLSDPLPPGLPHPRRRKSERRTATDRFGVTICDSGVCPGRSGLRLSSASLTPLPKTGAQVASPGTQR